MAYKRKAYKGIVVDMDQEFVCDTSSDIANLPTDVPQGSLAFVISDSTTWMINSSGTWVQVENSPGSSWNPFCVRVK